MRAEIEARHDAEVAASAAERPEELGVRRRRRLDDFALGRHQLRADELISGQTPRTDHPADPTAEGQSADADRGGVARADAQTLLGEHVRDVAPTRSATDAHECSAVRVCHDLDTVQCREVDEHAVIERGPRTVAAAAHDDVASLGGREPHRLCDVVDAGRHGRSLGSAGAGVRGARGIPPLILSGENRSGHNRAQGCEIHTAGYREAPTS